MLADPSQSIASSVVLLPEGASSCMQSKESSSEAVSTEQIARGGEASTSEPAAELQQPIGNDNTAKWKLYTGMARKLVAQVRVALCMHSICHRRSRQACCCKSDSCYPCATGVSATASGST